MKAISLLIIIGIAATSCIRPRKPVYPATKKVDSIDIYFDTKIPDPYRWLENDPFPSEIIKTNNHPV